MMNEAKLYQNSNPLQRRDAIDILQEFSIIINWKNDSGTSYEKDTSKDSIKPKDNHTSKQDDTFRDNDFCKSSDISKDDDKAKDKDCGSSTGNYTPKHNNKSKEKHTTLANDEFKYYDNSQDDGSAKDTLSKNDESKSQAAFKHVDISIDIGCGDGSVTVQLLKPILPRKHRLIGCDISKEMIAHAIKNYADPTTEFRHLDIEKDLPNDMVGKFDHAFSFYTLHWIRNQERALRNIFSLLCLGGDCLLIFLAHMPAYDVFRKMAATAKWHQYMYDVEEYVSPYHDSAAPATQFQDLMQKVGFTLPHVRCIQKQFIFHSIDVLKKSLMAINPFGHRLSEELREDFFEDYLDIVREMGLIEDCNNNGQCAVNIRTDYTLMAAYGTKPGT